MPELKTTNLVEFAPWLHPGKMVYRFHRYYCKPMRRMGKCSQVCSNCNEHLENIFRRLNNGGNPRDPYALLVWVIRDEIALISEADQSVAKPKKDWTGERVETNPFLLLQDEL